MKRRLSFIALLLSLTACIGAVLWYGHSVWTDGRDNRTIRDLAEGREALPAEDADPRVVHARVLFLAWRDRLDEARDLLPLLANGDGGLLSQSYYAIGNARMRRAFDRVEASQFEEAVPEVELAKSAYRDALRLQPAYLDAKVNLDVAMRVVRDLPRPLAQGEEDPENRPQQLWTDLPGMPRGAP